MPESIAVSVKNVSKQFDNVEVLRDINLTVEKGTVVSILGSSGSGKSTLLRCMNWLEQPDRGEIHIGGQRLGIDEQRGRAMSHRQLAKIRERVGMVFQSFNLWPHLTVQQNVSEALLRVKGMKRDEANAMAMQQLEKVGIDVYKRQVVLRETRSWLASWRQEGSGVSAAKIPLRMAFTSVSRTCSCKPRPG